MSPETDGPHGHANAADSAGVPWAGRRFQANPNSADDGSADPALLDALLRLRAGDGSQVEVVDAFRSARVLIPLVTEKGVLRQDQEPDSAQEPSSVRVPNSAQELGSVRESKSDQELGSVRVPKSAREPSSAQELGSAREPSSAQELGSVREPESDQELGSVREPEPAQELGSVRVPKSAREPESARVPKSDETVLKGDKTHDLSIVTVAAPDGRRVQPVFSSVDSMRRWDAAARPIPVQAVRVALSAADEQTDLIVLDPASDTEFVLRRPAVWAVAQDEPWEPSFLSPKVFAALQESIAQELAVIDVAVAAGDPDARMRGPELTVTLELIDGLDRETLDAVLARLARRWAADDRMAVLVDSLTVKLIRSAS